MKYVQVWFETKVDQHRGLLDLSDDQDEPIKRPCKAPKQLVAEFESLGVENVQSVRPVVFLEDQGDAWAGLVERAKALEKPVPVVLSAAVEHYLKTPASDRVGIPLDGSAT